MLVKLSFYANIYRNTGYRHAQVVLIFDIDRMIMSYVVIVICTSQVLMYASVYALGKSDCHIVSFE